MTSGIKVLLLFLGISTLSVWAVAIFMFFTVQNSSFIAKEHINSRKAIMEKQEITFSQPDRNTEKVYAIKRKQETRSMKLDHIRITNDSNKVSIDELLEMLDAK